MTEKCSNPFEKNRIAPPRASSDFIWEMKGGSSTPPLHWLLFDEGRRVIGCQCGFDADVEADAGYGDSVVAHLRGVVLREAAMDVQTAWLDEMVPERVTQMDVVDYLLRRAVKEENA